MTRCSLLSCGTPDFIVGRNRKTCPIASGTTHEGAMVWADNTRIISAFAVVLLHVAMGVITENAAGAVYWWFGNVYDSLVRWCVPVFVMISGAFLLDPCKSEELVMFYRKRLSRILAPILFWSAFFSAWTFAKGSLRGDQPTLLDLATRILSGKPYHHMWYLYMLVGLYMFTPYLRKVVANSTKQEQVFLITVGFVLAVFNDIFGYLNSSTSRLFINWFFSYVPFFLLGYFVCRDERRPPRAMLWTIYGASVCATCAGFYILTTGSGLPTGMYFYGFLSVTVIPMSVSIMYLLKSWTTPILNATFTKRVSFLTLGVYLIHPVILEVITKLGFGVTSFHPLFSIPVIAGIVFSLSLGGAWCIDQVPFLRRTI